MVSGEAESKGEGTRGHVLAIVPVGCAGELRLQLYLHLYRHVCGQAVSACMCMCMCGEVGVGARAGRTAAS